MNASPSVRLGAGQVPLGCLPEREGQAYCAAVKLDETVVCSVTLVRIPDGESGRVRATITQVAPAPSSVQLPTLVAIGLAIPRGTEVVPSRQVPPCASSIRVTLLGGLVGCMDYPHGLVVVEVDRLSGLFQAPLLVASSSSTSTEVTQIQRVIPLGSDCTVAQALRQCALGGPSLPLDWVRSNPWGVRRLIDAFCEAPELSPFPVAFSVPLRHTEGTNMYHQVRVEDVAGDAGLRMDPTFGLIGTCEEAAKVARRMPRVVQREGASAMLALVHVGQTQPAAHPYAVVDDALPACPSAGIDRLDALVQLRAVAHQLQAQHNYCETVLLCCNVFPETFLLWDEAPPEQAGTRPQTAAGVLVVHCGLGCAANTSNRLAELLRQLFSLSSS